MKTNNLFAVAAILVTIILVPNQLAGQVITPEGVVWNCGYCEGTPCAETNRVVAVLDTLTGILSVRGDDKMKNYTMEAPWQTYIGKITRIRVEIGVKSIGKYAFKNCTNLVDVSLPSGLELIEENSFYNCIKLASINLPNELKTIGNNALNTTKISSVTIPASVESIGRFAFAYCSYLKNLTFENGATPLELSNDVFYSCPFDSLYLGRNINDYNGIVSKRFKLISVSGNVTTLPNNAFKYCPKINKLVFRSGTSAITLGTSADSTLAPFHNCVIDTLLLDRNLNFSTAPFNTSMVIALTLGNNVSALVANEFRGCEFLSSISVPGSVSIISNGAFNGCKRLASINVNAENNYYASANGILYDKRVESLLFVPPYKEGDVDLPNALTMITERAFYGCNKITSVSIPASVTSIGSEAFAQSAKLKNIYVAPENTAYSSLFGVLYDKKANALLQYPADKRGTSFTIPASVNSITGYAFGENIELNTIYNLSIAPQPVTVAVFAYIQKGITNMVLYVISEDAKTAYANTAVWKTFKEIKVIMPAENLIISTSSKLLVEGETLELSAQIYPANATNRQVGWTSSNPAVAEVEIANGTVTVKAKLRGTSIITASTMDGSDKTAQCIVTVIEKEGGGGTTVAQAQEAVALRVFPNPATDHITVQIPDDNALQINLIYIYSLTGTMLGVYNVEGTQTKISVDNLMQGVYVLKVGSRAVKFLKK